jgi:hypothetical protein
MRPRLAKISLNGGFDQADPVANHHPQKRTARKNQKMDQDHESNPR